MGSTEFTEKEEDYIVRYLAKYTPDGRDRHGNQVWQTLCNNSQRKWPWAQRHPWQSWRNHYVHEFRYFDKSIARLQRKNGVEPAPPRPPRPPRSTPSGSPRVAFTSQDDERLVKYIAKYSATPRGRLGNALYLALEADEQDKWPWAKRHPWSAWRERYKRKRDEFDQLIADVQREHPPREVLETPMHARPRRARRRVIRDEDEEDEMIVIKEERGAQDERERVAMERQEEEEEEQIVQAATTAESLEQGRANGKRKGKEKRKRSDGSAERVAEERQTKKRRVAESKDKGKQLLEVPPPEETVEKQLEVAAEHADELVVDAPAAEGLDHLEVKGIVAREGEEEGEEEEEGEGEEEEEGEEGEEEEEAPREIAQLLVDYTGEIFDKHSESGSSTEEEDELASSSPEDGDDRATHPTNVTGGVVDEVEACGSRDATPSPSSTAVDPNQTPGKQFYPDVPSRTPVGDRLSLPGTYPATSTPNGQARPQNESIISQVIPAPQTLLKLEEAQRVTTTHPKPSAPVGVAQSPVGFASVNDTHPETLSNDIIRDSEQLSEVRPVTQPPSTQNAPDSIPISSAAGPSTLAASTTHSHKHHLVLRPHDDDIFQSDLPTPVLESRRNSPPIRKRKREPPRLDEGAFNTVFTDAKGRRRLSESGRRTRVSGVEDDSEEEEAVSYRVQVQPANTTEWPPRRGKDKGKQRETLMAANEAGPSQTAPTIKREQGDAPVLGQSSRAPGVISRPSTMTGTGPAQAHHAFSQLSQSQEAERTAHAERSQQPVGHHPFSQASQWKPFSDHLPSMLSGVGPSRAQPGKAAQPVPQFKMPSIQLSRIEAALKKDGYLLQSVKKNGDERRQPVASSSTTVQPEAPVKPRPLAPFKIPAVAEMPSNPLPPSTAEASQEKENSRSVRFDQIPSDIKGKGREMSPPTPHPYRLRRRHSIGDAVANDDAEHPHGDWSRLNGRGTRQSLPLLPTARTAVQSVDDSFFGISLRQRRSDSFMDRPRVRASSSEPDLQLSEADESVVVHIGIETAIQTMSENHGFNPEIVRRVWSKAKSLQRTDAVLREMREAAEKAALKQLEAIQGADEDVDDIVDFGMGHLSDRRASKSLATRDREGQPPTRSSHLRNSSILKIIPAVVKEGEEPASLQYFPPKQSRAGQYARLMKEGREDEALAREASRVGGISPFQTPEHSRRGNYNSEENALANNSGSPVALGNMGGVGAPAQDVVGDGIDASQVLADAIRDNKLEQLDEKWGPTSVRILLGKRIGKMLGGL